MATILSAMTTVQRKLRNGNGGNGGNGGAGSIGELIAFVFFANCLGALLYGLVLSSLWPYWPTLLSSSPSVLALHCGLGLLSVPVAAGIFCYERKHGRLVLNLVAKWIFRGWFLLMAIIFTLDVVMLNQYHIVLR